VPVQCLINHKKSPHAFFIWKVLSHFKGTRSLGEEMPRKKEGGMPWYVWLLLFILFLLLLKVFKVLPDPIEIETLASIGAAISVVGCFAWLFNKMFGFERRISTVETKLDGMRKDIDELKKDTREIRDSINKIKGKFNIT